MHKKSSIPQKFLITFFSPRLLFRKNLLPSLEIFSLFFLTLFLYFSSFLCFSLHFFFTKIKQNKKKLSDYWGKKGILSPHLNYWGARARAAPRVYAYAIRW